MSQSEIHAPLAQTWALRARCPLSVVASNPQICRIDDGSGERLREGIGQLLRIGSIVWGVRNVPRAIKFWSAALSYHPLSEPSPDWAILVPHTGPGPQFAITVVTSGAQDHQRHHLDLYADNGAAEIERLIGLGATRVEWRYPPGADYVVLADPDGNTFCVVEKRPAPTKVGSAA